MTVQEIREAAKVMEAYANGKKIQCNDNHLGNGEWVTTDNPSFNWDKYAYRIKPEPKYRPFKSQEECWNEMLKHQPLGWLRSKRIKDICQLITIKDGEIRIFADLPLYFSRAYREYEFLDGTPFGIKEE